MPLPRVPQKQKVKYKYAPATSATEDTLNNLVVVSLPLTPGEVEPSWIWFPTESLERPPGLWLPRLCGTSTSCFWQLLTDNSFTKTKLSSGWLESEKVERHTQDKHGNCSSGPLISSHWSWRRTALFSSCLPAIWIVSILWLKTFINILRSTP